MDYSTEGATLQVSTKNSITSRINFGDNTPPIVHIDIVPGDRLKISVMTKGFGGEMMSQVKLFAPYVGMEGVMDEIVKIVSEAGANPCPPIEEI